MVEANLAVIRAAWGYAAQRYPPAASRKTFEWGERIPIGVSYRGERPTPEERFLALEQGPLVARPLKPTTGEFERLKREFI